MLPRPQVTEPRPEHEGYLVFEDEIGNVTAIATNAIHIGPAPEGLGRPLNGGARVSRTTAFSLLQAHGGMLVQRSGVVSCQRHQADASACWTCYRRSCIREQSPRRSGGARPPSTAQLALRPSGAYARRGDIHGGRPPGPTTVTCAA